MKIAKLPTGKVLKFPDETPDDAIDQTVRAHLKTHIAKNQEIKQKEEKSNADGEQRHNQIMNALGIIAKIHHGHSQKMDEFLQQAIVGHKQIMDAFNDLTKAQLKLKKRKAIRDSKGTLIGAEEYD